MAKEAGLAALAITDHDTVAGWEEGFAWGRKLGVELVPGVELSTQFGGVDIHVLGYYMNPDDEAFIRKLQELRSVRQRRNLHIVEKLNQLGLAISWDEVKQQKPDNANLGRPHIAAALVQKGWVSSVDEAFARYLGNGGLAYVSLQRISPADAIHMIHQAGGAAVLAHPGIYGTDEAVSNWVAEGLDGIEVYHPDHSEEDEARYLRLTKAYGLVATAGSDFHGIREGGAYRAPLGFRTVDVDVVRSLRERAAFWSL